MAAYADHDDVAEYLGRTLSTEQQAQADVYVSAASAFIDRKTGVQWATSSPATELLTVMGRLVYLKNTPVTDITLVTIRDLLPGADETTLVEGSDYELVDAAKGILSLTTVYSGLYPRYTSGILKVVYSHSATIAPDNIKLAAIIIAAHYMNSALNPMGQRLKSLNDNRAVSITFRDQDVPNNALMLLPPKRLAMA